MSKDVDNVDSELLNQWTNIQQDQAKQAIFNDDLNHLRIQFSVRSGDGSNAFFIKAHDYDNPTACRVIPKSIEVDGVSRVGGVDIGYDPLDTIRAVVVLVILSFPALETLHTFKQEVRPTQPYIPTFLSMRELEHVQAIYDLAMNQIPQEDVPNVVFVDGMGRWHPRQAGLATAFGVTRNITTVGIGKEYQPILPSSDDALPDKGGSLLHVERAPARHFRATQKAFKQIAREKLIERGDFLGVPLHRDGPLVGATVYSAPPPQSKKAGRASPIYVSPGHQISLASSIALTLKCCVRPGVRLPEPIRLADRIGRDELARETNSDKFAPLDVISGVGLQVD